MKFKKPENNNLKISKKFAFFMEDVEEYKIWLEFYYVVYKYNSEFDVFCFQKSFLKRDKAEKFMKLLKEVGYSKAVEIIRGE